MTGLREPHQQGCRLTSFANSSTPYCRYSHPDHQHKTISLPTNSQSLFATPRPPKATPYQKPPHEASLSFASLVTLKLHSQHTTMSDPPFTPSFPYQRTGRSSPYLELDNAFASNPFDARTPPFQLGAPFEAANQMPPPIDFNDHVDYGNALAFQPPAPYYNASPFDFSNHANDFGAMQSNLAPDWNIINPTILNTPPPAFDYNPFGTASHWQPSQTAFRPAEVPSESNESMQNIDLQPDGGMTE